MGCCQVRDCAVTAPTDKELVKAAAWPAGIDNLSPEQALTRDDQGKVVIAVRDAQNTDFDKSGKPARRDGFAKVLDFTRGHSLWKSKDFPLALYVDAGELIALREDLSTFPLRGGLDPAKPLSYDVAAGRVYWSNGDATGCVSADGVALPWGVTGPGGQPTLTGCSGIGGLDAGTYQVAVTFLLAAGEESGASLAASVSVPAGGGITLTDIPQPSDPSQRIRIYMSGANGDALYNVTDLAAGISTLLLGAARRGKPLETQFLDVMPGGQIVRWFNSRLWVARESMVIYSEFMRYGLSRLADNHMTLPARIDMLEPVNAGGAAAGLFMAAGERTYFMTGATPAQMSPVIKYPHGVVPGTAVRVPGSVFGLQTTEPVPYWLARNGVGCVGLPGGDVMPLREGQVIAPSAEGGASLYRDVPGMRQVITTLTGATQRGLAIGDALDCDVIRHDV